MKKILALLFIIASFQVSAQVSFEKDTAKVVGDKSEFQITAKSLLSNNSNDTAFQFERITFSTCDFETAVCDQTLCYPPDTSIKKFNITSGSGFDMKVNFYPYNQDGHCTVLIYVRSLQDPDNYDSCYYSMRTTEFSSISEVKKDKSIKVFPNPSVESVQLQTKNLNAYNVEVYDVLGNLVKQFDQVYNNTSLDVVDLPKGVYILKVRGEYSGNVIFKKI